MPLIEYGHHVSVFKIVLDTVVNGDGFLELEETLYPLCLS